MFGRRMLTHCAAVVALVVATGWPAAAKERSLTLDFGDSKDGGISINLSGDWLAEALLEAVTESIDCDAESDRDVRKMLLHLRQRGEGSSYTMRDEDEVTKAYRRKGKLELHKFEPGEKPTRVVLPWAMGECMLGNPQPLRKLAGDFEMTIEKDGEIKLQID